MNNLFDNIFGPPQNNPFAAFAQDAFGGGDMMYPDMAQRFREAFEPQGEGPKGPPPASAKTLRQLPTVTVSPEDLVD
eukprot:CAMPEP_0116548144 /NCGR_PEP_ID=MMETSP0397-20121206/4161_1 /TAXON_ID=216820 /ORGANISM="Cyclophora tenuis, Strain ECT3854" /LENGTH=76 /DNA_ID=CAMNT_0004072737 /DNA_START=381 /DNA_END=608 /DNA_ORIENTATION=-